jgi:hypothetical protein
VDLSAATCAICGLALIRSGFLQAGWLHLKARQEKKTSFVCGYLRNLWICLRPVVSLKTPTPDL